MIPNFVNDQRHGNKLEVTTKSFFPSVEGEIFLLDVTDITTNTKVAKDLKSI
jgi:hypothetical protein